MGRPALRVEDLGKRYRLGLTHAGSLTELTNRWTRRLRGLPPVEAPVDAAPGAAPADRMGEFWALRDVNFEVQPGEVVGVIGRNGAGKSTLLKVLSRVTSPTVGEVRVRGRVGSLLEVGTGFHPELTGRENVYMNAALLGMSRREVRAKLDEIVDFAGVERFLDTPVKRYSSGMKVRLGFAVAAHLEPEVLIVDEVLSVGDAEFQKKCLGKMKDVAGHGRTVLFVSHNMGAVRALCRQCVLLSGGRVQSVGPTQPTIARYLDRGLSDGGVGQSADLGSLPDRRGAGGVRLSSLRQQDPGDHSRREAVCGEPLELVLRLDRPIGRTPGRIGLLIQDVAGNNLFVCSSETGGGLSHLGPGEEMRCVFPRLPLSGGTYSVTVFLELRGQVEDWLESAVALVVRDAPFFGHGRNAPAGWEGRGVLVDHYWESNEVDRRGGDSPPGSPARRFARGRPSPSPLHFTRADP